MYCNLINFSAHSCLENPIVLFFIPDGSKPSEVSPKSNMNSKKDTSVSFQFYLT